MKVIKQLLLLLAAVMCISVANAQKKKFVYTEGKNVMFPDGKPFIMRGTNLGNWLVPEGYMFRLKDVNSPRMINQAFTELIGPSAADSFWKTYLNSYVSAADIHYLKNIGMNS